MVRSVISTINGNMNGTIYGNVYIYIYKIDIMGILMEGFHIWMAGGYPKLAGFGKIPKWMMNDE